MPAHHSESGRLRRRTTIVLLFALVLACDDVTEPRIEDPPPDEELPDFDAMVSDPSMVVALGSPAADAGFVYVSLLPGTIQGADQIRIRNLTSQASIVAPLTDGGLDPVMVAATVGDTLELSALAGTAAVAEALAVVAAAKKPRVVRTEPPQGKRDVPLNAVIIVVFSEPMDDGSVSTERMGLLREGIPISANVELSADGLRAALTPTEPLASATEYQLRGDTTLLDRDGERLEEALESSFFTEETTAGPSAASLTLDQDTIIAHATDGFVLSALATVRDTEGNLLPEATIRWTTSDSMVAWMVEPSPPDPMHGVVVATGRTGSVIIRAEVPGSVARDSIALTLVDVAALSLRSVEVGEHAICVVTTAGRVYCDGDDAAIFGYIHTWIEVRSESAFADVSIGWSHACALDDHGAAYCWGDNVSGQLGSDLCFGEYNDDCTVRVPQRVTGGLAFQEITSGRFHTCGLTAAGEAYCWGEGYALGNGTYIDQKSPVPVVGGLTFSTLDAARQTTCGLTTSGDIHCWGGWYTTEPESDTSLTASVIVVPVATGLGFVDLSIGYEIAGSFGPGEICGLTAAGAPICWPMGSVAPTDPVPVSLPAGVALREIDSGMGPHTCGLTASGEVYCWGWSYDENYNPEPFGVRQLDGLGLETLSGGSGGLHYEEPHSCGIGLEGALYCWIGPDGQPERPIQ